MDVPDDTTWTWDSMIEIAAEVAAKAGVPFGVCTVFEASDALFSAFVRQNGRELFSAEAVTFEAGDAQAWFDLMVKAQKAKAIGTPQQISEEGPKPLDQSAIVVGSPPCRPTTPTSCPRSPRPPGPRSAILRFPSLTGKATDRKAWYKASQLFSASAKTKNPEAVVAFIDWYVNSPESANINLAERGVPCNAEMLAAITPKLDKENQAVVKFIEDIKPEVTDTPIAPPPGGGTTIAAPCPGTRPMCSSGAPARPTPRRSSWTR